MGKRVLYMDQKGKDELKFEIEVLRKKLAAAKSYSGSLNTDKYNPEYEETLREIAIIANELANRLADLKRVVIVEKTDDVNVIDLDDIVSVDIASGLEMFEESTFKLVGGSGNLRAEIPEISINSPLGSSIYKKRIGEECSYQVNGLVTRVIIKSKVVLEKEDEAPTLK